jgi:hypothetical protein
MAAPSNTPAPCHCDTEEQAAQCRRAGHPMILGQTRRLYELCSGNCPASNPCSPEVSERYRALWDGLPIPPETGPLPACAAKIEPNSPSSQEPSVPAPPHGPGTELKALLTTLGIEPTGGCTCNAKVLQMDIWGIGECRRRRDEIAGWLRDRQTEWGLSDKLTAVGRAFLTGLAFRLSPVDPFGSLVDEAIRRAEAQCPRGQ